jgi:hypothetical protein
MAEIPHQPDDLTTAAETPMDAGSQALSEALRSSFGIVKFLMVLLIGCVNIAGLLLARSVAQNLDRRTGSCHDQRSASIEKQTSSHPSRKTFTGSPTNFPSRTKGPEPDAKADICCRR